MSENKQIIDIPSFDDFKLAIDKEIDYFRKQNGTFCIAVIEFSLKDTNCPFPKQGFIEYIAKTINEKILEQDCFSMDKGNRFFVLLTKVNKHFATVAMASLISEIRNSVGNFIDINFGLAECPCDGSAFIELLESAGNSFRKNNQKGTESGAKIQDESLKNGLNKTLDNIQTNIKTILFKELYSMIKTISDYDPYLGEHTALVTKGSVILAKELNLPWGEVEKIAISALLHDIGYTAIPREIFLKTGKLTAEEWQLIKLHPTIASEQILKPIQILNDYIPYVQDHHEYMDGSGYPRSKKGDLIPIGAQIISVIDSYQAMIVDRPYRKALDFEEIVDIYIRNAGIKWDNSIITMFSAMIADPKTRQKLSEKNNLTLSKILSPNSM